MNYLALDRRLAQWSVAGLALAGCLGNQSGNLGSTKLGDTSRPAQRGSPVAALQAACASSGALTVAGSSVIRRQPYLQQVTSSSAIVGWVAAGSTGERVELTTPDRAPVVAAPGQRETTTVRSADEEQLWAFLEGLEPSTIYCYAIVDDSGALTERIGFRTAPTATSAEPVRFLAFGDSGGGGSDQQSLLGQMTTVPYDLIVHTGDLAYDDGSIGAIEDTVFGFYAELFRHIPFFPASGNHDYRTMQGAPFRGVFSLPIGGNERWYSYDWGRVHFVALDTEASYATQAAWLDDDLAATSLPWKVVYFHRPPYSSGGHGSDTSLRTALEPVFEKHRVQLVLAGHDHNYERMLPQRGIHYVVTGGGGVGTRPVGSSSFTAFSEDVIHFSYVEVTADEMVVHAIDATGVEFDSVAIPR